MKKTNYVSALLGILLLLTMQVGHAEKNNTTITKTTENPVVMLETTTKKIISLLKEQGDLFKKEPQRINKIIDKYILPNFDNATMAKLALGKNWKKATREQKISFIEEFKNLLVRTYSRSLLEFKDQEIKYEPQTLAADTKKTLVKATVIQGSGPVIPLIYRLRLKNNSWKIYDVKVDGVSLITSYRGTFSQEVRKGGIVGLIKYLQNINNKNSAKTA